MHSDVCGRIQVTSPSGNRYFFTLIDDHSRFTVIRLMKTKDEAATAIKEYVALMFNRFGRKPIALRMDNGQEYMSNDLEDFLRKKGIEHQFTVAYTPQQNGVAERKNRTLGEAARCMLSDANLNNHFWGEAILTATDLQNRLTSKVLDKTLIELFTRHKPDLFHMRIFGSRMFSLIPPKKKKCKE